MVVKVWDDGDKLIEFDFPTEEVIEFTDTDGKEVQMSVLGLYDPWLWERMGWETKREAAKWWVKNYANPVFESASGVFGEYITRFFDRNAMCYGAHLNSDLTYRKAYAFLVDIDNGLTYHYQGRVDGDTSILLSDNNQRDKPRYYATLGYSGIIHINFVSCTNSSTPRNWSRVLNYSFKMDPEEFNFFRTLDKECDEVPFYGMELEVSTKLSATELYRIVVEVEPKQEPFFIFKQDSSISGQYQFEYELVTVPASRRYLRKHWRILFQKINRLCEAKGLELSAVFDTSPSLSNGLHVHVSKDKFLGDFHRRKFMTAYNQWQSSVVEHMTKISGRPFDKYNDNSYCPIDRNFEGRTLARRLKKGMRSEQRSVCHDQNPNTMEVRLYQGIFNLEHILRCLDHVDAMFEFSSQLKLSCFGISFVSSFEEFILKGNKYKSIREFIVGAA